MTDRGCFIQDYCKIAVFFLVFFPGPGPYAGQSEDSPGKGQQAPSGKEGIKGKSQKPIDKKKEKEKSQGNRVFLPTDKISSDVPVSFPADI